MVEFTDLEEAKAFFNITDESMDELLQHLITFYSDDIEDITGVSEKTQKTKKALLYSIGCHLSRVKPDEITPTIAYTVGIVKERLQSPSTAQKSWCSEYEEMLSEIIYGTGDYYAGVWKRKGISDVFGSSY